MNCNKAYNSNKNGYVTTKYPTVAIQVTRLNVHTPPWQGAGVERTWHEYRYKNVNYNLEKKRITFRWQYLGKISTDFKQGRIHGSISRVRVGRGSIVVEQGQ